VTLHIMWLLEISESTTNKRRGFSYQTTLITIRWMTLQNQNIFHLMDGGHTHDDDFVIFYHHNPTVTLKITLILFMFTSNPYRWCTSESIAIIFSAFIFSLCTSRHSGHLTSLTQIRIEFIKVSSANAFNQENLSINCKHLQSYR